MNDTDYVKALKEANGSKSKSKSKEKAPRPKTLLPGKDEDLASLRARESEARALLAQVEKDRNAMVSKLKPSNDEESTSDSAEYSSHSASNDDDDEEDVGEEEEEMPVEPEKKTKSRLPSKMPSAQALKTMAAYGRKKEATVQENLTRLQQLQKSVQSLIDEFNERRQQDADAEVKLTRECHALDEREKALVAREASVEKYIGILPLLDGADLSFLRALNKETPLDATLGEKLITPYVQSKLLFGGEPVAFTSESDGTYDSVAVRSQKGRELYRVTILSEVLNK